MAIYKKITLTRSPKTRENPRGGNYLFSIDQVMHTGSILVTREKKREERENTEERGRKK